MTTCHHPGGLEKTSPGSAVIQLIKMTKPNPESQPESSTQLKSTPMRFDLREFPAFLRNFGLVLLAGGVLHGAFEMWDERVYIVSVWGFCLIVLSFLRR